MKSYKESLVISAHDNFRPYHGILAHNNFDIGILFVYVLMNFNLF